FDSTQQLSVSEISLSAMVALVDFIERIPEHLITLSPSDLGLWFVSLAGIKTAITRGVQGDPRAGAPPVRPIMKLGKNPVLVIRDLLKQCDDEAPHPETSAIPFVDDPELRQSLRNDLDEAWASM